MMCPEVGGSGSLQARRLRRVVLPAPEAPMTAVTCPALTMPDTLLSRYLWLLLLEKGSPSLAGTA